MSRAALLLVLAVLASCRGSVEPVLPVLALAADAANSRILFIRAAAVLPPGPGDSAGAIAGWLDLGGALPWDLAAIPERDRLLVLLSQPDGTSPRVAIYDTTGLNTISPALTPVTSVLLPPFAVPAGATPPNVDPRPYRLSIGPGGRYVAVTSLGRLDPVLGDVPAVIDLLDLDASSPYVAAARLVAGRLPDLRLSHHLVALPTTDHLVVAASFLAAPETLDGDLLGFRLSHLVAGQHPLSWRVVVPPGQLVNPTDLLALEAGQVAVLATPAVGNAAARVIDTTLPTPILQPLADGFPGADRILRFAGELVFARRAGGPGAPGQVLLPGETGLRTIINARAFTVSATGYLHAAGFAPLPPAQPDGVLTTLDLALIRAGVATGVRLELALPGLGEIEALATLIVRD